MFLSETNSMSCLYRTSSFDLEEDGVLTMKYLSPRKSAYCFPVTHLSSKQVGYIAVAVRFTEPMRLSLKEYSGIINWFSSFGKGVSFTPST